MHFTAWLSSPGALCPSVSRHGQGAAQVREAGAGDPEWPGSFLPLF